MLNSFHIQKWRSTVVRCLPVNLQARLPAGGVNDMGRGLLVNNDSRNGQIAGLHRLFQQACLAVPMVRVVMMMMKGAMKHTKTKQQGKCQGQDLMLVFHRLLPMESPHHNLSGKILKY